MTIAYIIVSIISIIWILIMTISSFLSHQKDEYDDELETEFLYFTFCEKCGCKLFLEEEKCPNCGEKIKD